nr:hypothetical protein BCU33_14605 [Vibrio lentus]
MDFLSQIIDRRGGAIYALIGFQSIVFTMFYFVNYCIDDLIDLNQLARLARLARLACDRYKNALTFRAFNLELMAVI